jgi:hydrogenase maturation factor
VEGTSIIAREVGSELLARGWAASQVEAAARYLYEPGISVLTPALLAVESGLATAMHDPTEGGIATGLLELALAADVGLEIDLEAIPVPDLSRRLCAKFGLDPLGVIASGALLATTAPAHAPVLLQRWRENGWPGALIGRITPKEDGLVGLRAGRRLALPRFQVDEVTKLWASASAQ